MLSHKQKEVVKYLQSVDEATLQDILDNVSFGYYHNGKKHLGTLLKRMINRQLIERVKKGTYRIKTKIIYSDTPTLFTPSTNK